MTQCRGMALPVRPRTGIVRHGQVRGGGLAAGSGVDEAGMTLVEVLPLRLRPVQRCSGAFPWA